MVRSSKTPTHVSAASLSHRVCTDQRHHLQHERVVLGRIRSGVSKCLNSSPISNVWGMRGVKGTSLSAASLHNQSIQLAWAAFLLNSDGGEGPRTLVQQEGRAPERGSLHPSVIGTPVGRVRTRPTQKLTPPKTPAIGPNPAEKLNL